MKKTDKPLAVNLEFEEQLRELLSQAPEGFGFLCFYYLTNGEKSCEEGVMLHAEGPFIADAIVSAMEAEEHIDTLIQAVSSYVTECRTRENKGNHDKHQKTTV